MPGIPSIRSRRGPRRRRPTKLHAYKGYAYEHLRQWLRSRHIPPRIARKAVNFSTRLGGIRRLHHRYERKADAFLGFAGIMGIAAIRICYSCLTTGRTAR